MEVLKEILEWSEKRPAWQREALRRLVQNGKLEQTDFDELLIHCKATHGLAEKVNFTPLTESHIPDHNASTGAVTLNALTHKRGVNALAENQTIKFGKHLTVVYGQNAAGKSGYTRVLKKACRARGSEEILGNVLSEKVPSRPSAALTYSTDTNEYKWEWTDSNDQDPTLGNVSVFDRHCATVYLSQKTDVAFRPFGLDLFDKLALCCEKLRAALEKERQELVKKQFDIIVPLDTKAFSLVSNINALTDIDPIKEYASLSNGDLEHLKKIRIQLAEVTADDTSRNKKELELRLKRIQNFHSSLKALLGVLSSDNVSIISETIKSISLSEKQVKKIEGDFLKHSHLDGVGGEEWSEMWQAAAEYSQVAYPDKEFPYSGKVAHCVLCQQKIDRETSERFESFSKFMKSNVQTNLVSTQQELESKIQELESFLDDNLSESDGLSEIAIEDEELATLIGKQIKKAETAIESIVKSVKSSKKIDSPEVKFDFKRIDLLQDTLKNRIKNLSEGADKSQIKKLQDELRELEGKKALKDNLSNVLKEIERQKRLAVYSVCLDDVGTTGITKKSTEITKQVVTEHLINSFHDELKKLGFDHLEIDLQPSGASRGALYHKLVIKRATNIEVQNVVSEGEARALSIAAFFAELSTASNKSGILFDDPVSSLDHLWRERIAARLVEEAQKRQVIIFTHDIVFLTTLSRIAEARNVSIAHQYIHREHEGAGVSSPDLPWVAMKVKDRIGVLKAKHQTVAKIERTSSKEEYEKEASHIYGYLREAWERALEEILIGGIVERYRPSVQTLKVKLLADITQDDCVALEAGMAKCSRWLPGHDLAGAETSTFPNASELQKDIELLENWVKEINKRRN